MGLFFKVVFGRGKILAYDLNVDFGFETISEKELEMTQEDMRKCTR